MAEKITGVPAINPVRRVRRLDTLDREDQKHATEQKTKPGKFRRLLNEQQNSAQDEDHVDNDSVNVKA